MNPYRGWEIYEKGIYDILTNTRENYGNIKCYISENGMGVEGEERFVNSEGIIEDDYRIEFVTDHLKYVHQAIQKEPIVWVTTCGHVWTTGLGQMLIRIAMALSLLIWHKTVNGRSKIRSLV